MVRTRCWSCYIAAYVLQKQPIERFSDNMYSRYCGNMKNLVPILIVMASLSFNQGFISNHNVIHKKGYCIWYDQCVYTQGESLNCLYNGPSKELNDSKGIVLLNKLCPKFAKNRTTCCSTKQLVTLDKLLITSNLRRYTSPCPSCWQNLMNLFCELTCSPDQSMFMEPTVTIGFPPIISILKVDYYVSMDFKTGLFNSCKDMVYPGSHQPILCDKSVKTCTPRKLLENLDRSAGLIDIVFDIRFPEILPAGMNWMNDDAYSCNQSFVNPWTHKASDKCSCTDCSSSCGHKARNITNLDPYNSPSFRKTILNITANSTYPQNHTGYHRYPDDKFIPFGHIFHTDLLNQALDLQQAMTHMKVPYNKNKKTVYITLDDVCYKPPTSNNKCVVESVFQYFQNNKSRLNYCVTSLGHECERNMADLFMADYHDHVLYCPSLPFGTDEKFVGTPCLGENGLPTLPYLILDGYNDTDYHMANYLVITFVFKNHKEETKNKMTEAWEKAFLSYMDEYVENPKHGNLTIKFVAQSSISHGNVGSEVAEENNGYSSSTGPLIVVLTVAVGMLVGILC